MMKNTLHKSTKLRQNPVTELKMQRVSKKVILHPSHARATIKAIEAAL